MIDEALFVAEREAALSFLNLTHHSLAKLKSTPDDYAGASLNVQQIASGEVLCTSQEQVQGVNGESIALLSAGLDEIQGGQELLTLEAALSQCPENWILHINVVGAFFGDTAIAEEIDRIVSEAKLIQRVVITLAGLTGLRALHNCNSDYYYGWCLDRRLLGGPVKLEDHPILQMLDNDRVVFLSEELATPENVAALQEGGLAVGVQGVNKAGVVKEETIVADWQVA